MNEITILLSFFSGFIICLIIVYYLNRELLAYNNLDFREKNQMRNDKLQIVKESLIEDETYTIEYISKSIEEMKYLIDNTNVLFGNKRNNLNQFIDIYTILKEELE